MLYLHCGWDRTSTSSLQAALFAHKDDLAAVGIVYPDMWVRPRISPTHNGLHELLNESLESEDVFGEFRGFLAGHADRDVLLSAEALTNWLLPQDKQDTLLRLLAVAQEVMPTRCIWTLRRLDEALASLYLLELRWGVEVPPPDECFDEIREPGQLFAGLHRVEQAVGDDVVYVKYESAGTHNRELLRAFDIPERLRVAIWEELERRPRLNVRLSHKQAVTLLNLDTLSARVGYELDAVALRSAFNGDEFEFEEDRPCALVDSEARRALHERALAAAQRNGITAYADFFEDARFDEPGSVGLEPELLTDGDLERLLAHLAGHSPADPGAAS
jgi:hypothetical protein